MNDFQSMLQGLKESKDFIAMDERIKIEKKDSFIPFAEEVSKSESLELNKTSIEKNSEESRVLDKLNEIQKSLDELDKKIDDSRVSESFQYSDISKFIMMIEHYQYSLIVDRSISFENPLFNSYRDNLIVISQNILANSFRFFEKSDILDKTIVLGEKIKANSKSMENRVDKLADIFKSMREALNETDYKKGYFFAKLLNDKGLILNSITIINEILGEYIVASARKISSYSEERIDAHLYKISISKIARRGYYNFYKNAKNFFRSHFSKVKEPQAVTFFGFRDYGNKEIEREMKRLFNSNKMNKSNLFVYSYLIEDVRLIRNDLAHGNNSGVYGDIQSNINEVLIDFKYLSIDKNFLQL